MKFEVDLNVTFLFPWFLLGPLQITAADLSHSGRYSCVAKNAAGTAHRHVELTVHGKRCTETIKPNMLLKAPLNVFFHYLWLIILHITNSHFWLHIYFSSFVTLSFFFFYNCLYLYFIEPPVIQSHPSTLDVILNNHVTLPCRATGFPRPTITWQKEGINIFTAGENKSCATVVIISKLFISLQ